jgi:hypothetical protein
MEFHVFDTEPLMLRTYCMSPVLNSPAFLESQRSRRRARRPTKLTSGGGWKRACTKAGDNGRRQGGGITVIWKNQ